MQGNLTALVITFLIVLAAVLIGFIAGRNKNARSSVEEWSVGDRRLGSLLVWFLIGADIYTAYTFLGLTSAIQWGKHRLLRDTLRYFDLFTVLFLSPTALGSREIPQIHDTRRLCAGTF